MSFMRTLVSVGIGFAAAKGIEKYQKMGGMAGMQSMMSKQGGMADQMGQMADKFGVPGGSAAVKDMMGKFGVGTDNPASVAGFSGTVNAIGGAAAASGGSVADLFAEMTQDTTAGQLAEENAKLMIRAMIQAAKADGEIDAEEQAKIIEYIGEADAEELAYVREQLAAPLDPMALAREATEQTKAQIYSMSLMAITVDNMAEVQYLDTLAAALGLTDEMRAQVHRQMGINQG